MKKFYLYFTGIVLLGIDLSAQTTVDFDGNEYQTIAIGNQIWMAENLNSLHYFDGVPIEEVWAFDNNPDTASIYGRLYSWEASVRDTSSNSIPSGIQGACPTGWHLPSIGEWRLLTDYLGGEEIAGGKLKEAGLNHWFEPNTDATNVSGFTALPGGYRADNGEFQVMGHTGFFWSTTVSVLDETNYIESIWIGNATSNASFMGVGESDEAYSIRCVKNDIASKTPGIKEDNLNFYPNPALDKITIGNKINKGFFKIYSLQGKLLLDEIISFENKMVDISSLQNGVYIIQLISEGNAYSEKLVIRQ